MAEKFRVRRGKIQPILLNMLSDIILICYSIESPESLKNVSEVWIQEIRHYCPTCPIILVGNKSDLKDSSNAVRFVSVFFSGARIW